ncbi:hypothetical protein M5D96_008694 [Drosophila gunungcola]|uniref:Uncharacterized protein n=1 Tax=Drosophila gunungcola TaxID=103775 RepID=A0A9P9YKV0_9MUSC|nr:hypothetical protein M5D96_008694 [Drosophila gunungcola]
MKRDGQTSQMKGSPKKKPKSMADNDNGGHEVRGKEGSVVLQLSMQIKCRFG